MSTADAGARPAQPPSPPHIPRRVAFDRGQLAGVVLLLAVPALALCGVFGTAEGTARAAVGELEVVVRHPERSRYKTRHSLDVALHNLGSRPLPGVTVAFDLDYLAAFADVRFDPPGGRAVNGAYEVALDAIAPGETRHIRATLETQQYGRHRGAVVVGAAGAPSGRLAVATLTLP